ncbi:Uncharacterized protein ImpA [hydrothermal vent metagenome]|uniref:Uncharacterized protein ImpA n=1 Tax=hydrothermal vent metagenome TaxID=652676 RepID=A0A3B0W286_9ZZZZ
MIKPIADEQAVGTDLRSNISSASNYQVLRGVRNQARNNERAALANGELSISNLADWKVMLEKVPEILKTESKDLEVVAWLIEALTRNYGFLGLARGYSLARQLIEAYGESLYPLIDEDGISTQLAPLIGLNGFDGEGALIAPIRSISLTQGDFPGPLAAWQCEQVFEIERLGDESKREARLKQGGVSREQLDRIMMETATPFIHETQENIDLAIEEYSLFQAVIDNYSQADPQPTSKVMDTLVSCRQTLTYVAGNRLANNKTEDEVEVVNEQGQKGESVNEVMSHHNTIGVKDRQTALKALDDVAGFFRSTEPHSPVSYSIEQAIRWSNMPLTELLKELIPDEAARTKYKNLSGIPSESNK